MPPRYRRDAAAIDILALDPYGFAMPALPLPKRRASHSSRKVGAPPGTLLASSDALPTRIHTMRFDPTQLTELEGVPEERREEVVTWIDVVGTQDVEGIEALGRQYGLHPLALEDALSPTQRPKLEDYPDTLFLILRVARENEGRLDIEQIAFFIGKDFVITIQEREGDAFEPVRERLRIARGRVRQHGSTYLAYALIDASVDAMFPLLEAYDERLTELEDDVFHDPDPALAEVIHTFGRELRTVRRVILPLGEALGRLMRDQHPLITEDDRLYFRDCQDHLSRMLDLLESLRESLTGLSGAHLANLGQHSNDVMKVLTIIATLFMPLGFIAGLYGMNFDTSSPWNLPELSWRYGYPFALGLMLTFALGLIAYFKRKNWF